MPISRRLLEQLSGERVINAGVGRGGQVFGIDTVTIEEVDGYTVPTDHRRFIREQTIHFYARGLKPATKVHIFFDGQRVSDRVIPGSITDLTAITPTLDGINYIRLDPVSLATRSGLAPDDQAITVANNGTIAGAFYLPGGRFLVGDRDFVVADVNQYSSISAATTYARQTFHAFNFRRTDSTSTRSGSLSFGTYNSDGVTSELGLINRPTIFNNANTNQTYANVWIKLYTQPNYGGVSRTFYGACTDLRTAGAANGVSYWDSKKTKVVRSIEITPGSEWMIYEDVGCGGRSVKITANTPEIEGSTVRVNGLSAFQPVKIPVIHNPVVTTPSDPIVQTFTITPELANSREGIFASSIDLFFAQKDPVHGVFVEIRETTNGFPSNVVLPFGRVWLPSASVNTSNDGSTATTFTFDNLIYLKTGQEYCFTIIPDAHSPEYEIFTAETGATDLDTGTVVRQDWGNGKMFQATNNRSWTPLTSEDIKFTLRQAVFSTTAGYVIATNKDYEFFTLTSTSNSFIAGELAFKVSANIPGSITTSNANLIVSGTSTTFSANLAVGGYITIPDSNSSPTAWDLVKIANINSNTSLTLARYPRYTVTSGNTMSPPVGKVDFYNVDLMEMHLIDSTAANSTFLFSNGSTIIGSLSGANAVVNVVTNKIVNHFQPLIGRYDPASTAVEFKFSIIDNAYSEQSFVVAGLNATNYLNDKECMIASRSNEIVNNSGDKSFTANISVTTDNTFLSSFLDLQNMSIITYRNKISSNNTSEDTLYGYANSKHISSTIILGANQEAEDIKVFVTAHRPANTDIEIYAKILNASDPEPFDNKSWSKLTKLTSNALFSDPSTADSLIELEYTFPTGPSVYDAATGVASVANNSAAITGTSSQWQLGTGNNVLAVGDVIKIVDPNDEDNYDVQRVTVVTNNTSITVGSNVAFTSTGAKVYKLQIPNAAFKYEPNDKVVRYFSNTGGAFDGYRTFALKIVLLADNSFRVPRVSDIRSIALSV